MKIDGRVTAACCRLSSLALLAFDLQTSTTFDIPFHFFLYFLSNYPRCCWLFSVFLFFFFFFLHTRHPLNHARGYKSGAFPGIQLIQQEISAKWSKRISRQREPFETNTSYPKVRVTWISRYPFGFAVKSSSPQKKHQPRWHPSTAHSMFLLSFCRRVAQLVVVQSSYLTRLNSV